MSVLERVFGFIEPIFPMSVTIVAALLIILAVRMIAEKRYATTPGLGFRMQVVLLILTFLSFMAVVLTMPVGDTTRGQLLSLIGVVLSAAIALSSTTFVGNAMAGFMLRSVHSFRPGDFIRIGDHFGRVSELGLFHVEIQTEDRDLTTLPNLHLVTTPYKVVRSSGTMITAEVSLSYDIAVSRVSKALLRAATAAGLTDPYVHVVSLGDFSVVYRVAGLLAEVRHILSSRSQLREEMLRELHDDGIEIVSPSFMNTRAYNPERAFIPPDTARQKSDAAPTQTAPEAVVFDKAQEAETLEQARAQRNQLKELIKKKKSEQGDADPTLKSRLEVEIERLESRLSRMDAEIKAREAETD